MNPLIMIATPCFGGMLTQPYMLSVIKLMNYAAQKGGFNVGLKLLGYDALVSRARSTLVAAFMDVPEATHLLFVDADISFEPEQVHRLLEADKEFAGAFYPLKIMNWQGYAERANGGEPFEQAAFSYVGTLRTGEALAVDASGFATASYAGGGFQLLRRSVFEKMFAAFPQTHFRQSHAFPRPKTLSPNLYALFDCIIDEATGVYLSEDYSFCQRWRTIGGEIWLDLKSKLTHSGSHDFNGDFETRLRTLDAEAAPLKALLAKS